jgi:hypothetical protein
VLSLLSSSASFASTLPPSRRPCRDGVDCQMSWVGVWNLCCLVGIAIAHLHLGALPLLCWVAFLVLAGVVCIDSGLPSCFTSLYSRLDSRVGFPRLGSRLRCLPLVIVVEVWVGRMTSSALSLRPCVVPRGTKKELDLWPPLSFPVN